MVASRELGLGGGVAAADGAAHDHQIGNLRAEAGTPGEQLGKVAERSDGDDDALPLGLLIEPAGEGGDRVA